jgi:hypothetical protein
MNFVADLLWLILPTVRHSSVGSFVERDLFIRISLKNRSIDNLEAQKKYISMKNSQFFNYLLYAKSK